MKFPAVITPRRWRTIALVGMAPSARPLIPHIAPDVGLFMIAAAWNMQELPRQPDVALEIHQTWILSHPNYSLGLWDWLHYSHPFTIFTYQTEPTIPGSVRYPLEQLQAEFMWPVTRGPDEQPVKFFTSSLDYLMALALAYEPERIEIYGFDMASDTEYRFQREGGHFWYGVCAGRGVRLWVPEDSPMLKSRLYSYEGSQWVQERRLVELGAQMTAGMERAKERHDELTAAAPLIESGNPTEAEIAYYQEIDKASDTYHIYSGAAQCLEQLQTEVVVEGILARQQIELVRSEVIALKNHHISRLNWFEGHINSLKVRYAAVKAAKAKADEERNASEWYARNAELAQLDAQFDAEVAEQNQARMDYFVHNGATQILYHLIAECDLQADAEFHPVLDIVSIDVRTGSSTEAMVRPEPVEV